MNSADLLLVIVTMPVIFVAAVFAGRYVQWRHQWHMDLPYEDRLYLFGLRKRG